MNRWKIAAIVGLSVVLSGCAGCTRVSAGYVGLKSTVTGTGRGMSEVAIGPSWVYYNAFTESVLEYPTFVKTVVWTHATTEGNAINEEITFTTKDKMQVAADISLAYAIIPEKAANFYLTFRSDDLDTFTMGFMRNLAREKFDAVAGRYSVDQIMGDNAEYLAEVRKTLQGALDPLGVRLAQFGFIGAPRPPQGVTDSINLTVKAAQIAIQKQNELIQVQADAAKNVAQAEGDAKATLARAEAQSQANRKLSESLTSNLIEYEKLQKWDGHLPQVQSGSGGGVLLNLGNK